MRRKDREITDRGEILEILRRCSVCNVALADGGNPYVIPMNYGILEEDGRLSLCFHCAGEGTKLDILHRNPRAAFAVSGSYRLEMTETNDCTMRYESVCGKGVFRRAENGEKIAALNAIMDHYRPGAECAFDEALVARTTILILEVETLTGKRSAAIR